MSSCQAKFGMTSPTVQYGATSLQHGSKNGTRDNAVLFRNPPPLIGQHVQHNHGRRVSPLTHYLYSPGSENTRVMLGRVNLPKSNVQVLAPTRVKSRRTKRISWGVDITRRRKPLFTNRYQKTKEDHHGITTLTVAAATSTDHP